MKAREKNFGIPAGEPVQVALKAVGLAISPRRSIRSTHRHAGVEVLGCEEGEVGEGDGVDDRGADSAWPAGGQGESEVLPGSRPCKPPQKESG